MFKRVITVFVALVIFFVSVLEVCAETTPNISAKSAALMIAETGELVYAKSEHEKRPMASTTKIMTSILALESDNLDAEFQVTSEMVTVEGSSMGLLPGDTVTLRTLVSGMLLESGNDAANSVAYAVSGSVPPFIEKMNDKAKQIGMQDTSFATPSGLDAETHYSTAYDMAILGCYAIANPEFLRICSQKSEAVYYGNPPYRRVLTNHNRLLSMVDGCVGVKTGFTKKSGRCLVSAVKRDGITLVAVTLSASEDWKDHEKLYDYGFQVVKRATLQNPVENMQVQVVGANVQAVDVSLLYTPHIPIYQNELPKATKIYLPQFLYAPIKAGQTIGFVRYMDDNRILSEVPIVAMQDANVQIQEPQSLWKRFKTFIQQKFM